MRHLILFSVACSFLLAVSCGPEKKLTGNVTDNFGRPLDEVTIKISGTAYEATTSKNGSYEIDYAPGSFQVSFHKEGYVGTRREFTFSEKQHVPIDTVELVQRPTDPVALVYANQYYSIPEQELGGESRGLRKYRGSYYRTHDIQGEFEVIPQIVSAEEDEARFYFVLGISVELWLFKVDETNKIFRHNTDNLANQTQLIRTSLFERNGVRFMLANLNPGRYAFVYIKPGTFSQRMKIHGPAYSFEVRKGGTAE